MPPCAFCELFKKIYFLEDLQVGSSETPVRDSFFNKVANLTAPRLLAVLERDCCTVISLLVLRNFWENVIAEHLLVTASHIIFFFPFADK